MRFANPIYDSVFKHLMEDLEIARGFIGRLLGVKVVELQLLPQELTERKAASLGTPDPLVRVFRLDFAAVVELEDGRRFKVLVELQKALASEAVGRFRTYLGKHYAKPPVSTNQPGGSETLPIIAIYLLGFSLGEDIPKVVRVQRRYLNAVTRQALPEGVKSNFLEKLTHDAVAVQIPLLDDHADTEMERALIVFDQRRREDNPHFLALKDGEIQGADDPLLRQMLLTLLKVASDEETQKQMDVEDEVLGYAERLQEAQRAAQEERRLKEEECRLKEEALSKLAEMEAKLRRLENRE